MQNITKKAELLAPAGSVDGLKAAIHAGADAVYIGGQRFGARAYADSVQNSQEADLLAGIDYAHIHGRNVYLTVNTLLKPKEIEELPNYIKPYYEQGIDAVIVQDMGVFKLLREYFPDLPIHASTQMTITSAKGAEILKQQGAKRVVLARELSLDEIADIHRAVDIEIEAFIHGALCVCYSGQCLFSSILGGRSGNRGRCAQPCRLPYQLLDERLNKQLNSKKEAYPLSPKDIGAIDILPEIIQSGVYSLKIEGRMKRPEYAAGVVHIYRKYLDAYLSSDKPFHVTKEDREMLLDLYSRGGMYTGYYKQHNGKDMMSMDSPAYRTGPEELFTKFKQLYMDKECRRAIQGTLTVAEGGPLSCSLQADNVHVSVAGATVQTAQNQPATKETLEKQMRKTGNTPYAFTDLSINVSGKPFVPVKEINELRREAIQKLTDSICVEYRRTWTEPTKYLSPDNVRKTTTPFILCASVETKEQLQTVLQSESITEILIDSSYLPVNISQHKDVLCRIASECHAVSKKCYLIFPAILRKEWLASYRMNYADMNTWGLDGVYCKNMEEIGFLEEIQYSGERRLDYNMYTMNPVSISYWKEQGFSSYTLPVELNSRELQGLGGEGSELVVYGYLTLMTTAQCMHKNFSACDKKPTVLSIEDRYHKRFRIRNHCGYCYNTIENSLPLSLFTNTKEIASIAPKRLRLIFTREQKKDVEKITDAFCKQFLEKSEQAVNPVADFTRGHFKRGIE